MKKRILGLLLALCLVVGLLPATALAAEETAMWPYFAFQKADGTALYQGMRIPPAEPFYFKTVDGRVTDVGASATDYNIMLSWVEGGTPTLTLKGAVINNDKMDGINFGRARNYPKYHTSTLDIVVVADSSITVGGGSTYSAITSFSTGDITIKSENNATLTLTDYRSGAAGGISVGGNLKLDGLNLKYTNTYNSGCAGLLAAKNVTIENSTISSHAGGMIVNGDLLIKNSEVNMRLKKTTHFVDVAGTITLEESTVAIGHTTGSPDNKIFSKTPVLVCSTGAEVIRSVANSVGAPGWDESDYTFAEPTNSNYVTVDFTAGSTYSEGTTPAVNFFGLYPNPPHVHTPAADDGDCTTAVKCTVCNEVVTPAAAAHVAGADDGDCTTAVKCANTGCTKDAVAAAQKHTLTRTDCSVADTCSVCNKTIAAGEHSGGTATCKAKAKCEHCDKEYGELAACKPAADDGDCSTAVKCTVCEKVVTAAKEHKYTNNTDTTCDNTGCTHTRKVETPSTKPDTNNPQTGDEFNMVLWVSLLAVSAVGFAAVLVFGKKRAVK